MGNLESFMTRERQDHPIANRREFDRARQQVQEDVRRGAVVPVQWTIPEASLRATPTAFSALESSLVPPAFYVTPSARCAALEYARLSLGAERAHGAPLFEFIVGRCGGSIAQQRDFHAVVLTARNPNEARIFAQESDRVLRELRRGQAAERSSVGIGSAHDRGHVATAMAMVGVQLLRVESPMPPMPVNGFVSMEATLLSSEVAVRARITQGTSAIVPCDVTQAADRIVVRCPYAATDVAEVIEIVAVDGDGRPTGLRDEFFALRDAAAMRSFATRAQSDSRETLRTATAERINALRTAMGLAALIFVPEQSETNTVLAAVFFEPNPRDSAMEIATAGWDVSTLLAEGESSAGEAPLGSTADELAAHLLQSPIDREMLLRPSMTHLAIGLRIGPSSLQSVVSVYRAFPSGEPEANQARLLAIAQAERSRAGLPPFSVIPMPAPLERAMQQMAEGENPTRAFQAAAQELGPVAASTDFTAYMLNDLDSASLLANPTGTFIAISVVPLRPRGSARGAYLVFLLRSETAVP